MVVNNKLLVQAIKTNDVIRVRSIIIGQISRDRRLNVYLTPAYMEFASEQLLKQGYQLYDEDEEGEKYTNKSDWNADLWADLCVSLQYNFSKNKLNCVIKVMSYLRTEENPEFQIVNDEDRPVDIEEVNGIVLEKRNYYRVTLGAGIGAIAGLATGAFFHKPIIGTLFGAILGSGFGFLTDEDKDK